MILINTLNSIDNLHFVARFTNLQLTPQDSYGKPGQIRLHHCRLLLTVKWKSLLYVKQSETKLIWSMNSNCMVIYFTWFMTYIWLAQNNLKYQCLTSHLALSSTLCITHSCKFELLPIQLLVWQWSKYHSWYTEYVCHTVLWIYPYPFCQLITFFQRCWV